jgi:hypothetical protein
MITLRSQINIVCVYFVVFNSFQLAYHISLLFLDEYFCVTKDMFAPLTDWMAVYMFVYKLCVLLPIIFNYFVFYFMVRESYHQTRAEDCEDCVESDELEVRYRAKTNREIDSFLNLTKTRDSFQ